MLRKEIVILGVQICTTLKRFHSVGGGGGGGGCIFLPKERSRTVFVVVFFNNKGKAGAGT